jgi:hypothetical protein
MEKEHSSFGWYEAMRILVPGFYFACLLSLYVACVFSGQLFFPWFGFWFPYGMAFLTLAAGLTMYAKETPKRRRAFTENQPSTHLQTSARLRPGAEPLSDQEAQSIYFYLLNNHVPTGFHDKVFLFGSVYQIMVWIRRTSFWFGVVALASLAILYALGHSIAEEQPLVLFALLVWIVYFLNVRYNKADRKMQENYRDQIFWLEMNEEVVKGVLQKYARHRHTR